VIDYRSLLVDPIYGVLGVAASFVAVDLWPTADGLTVIDETKGDGGQALGSRNNDIFGGINLDMGTIGPKCCIRTYELSDKGISRADLDNGTITFNGKTWKILSSKPKPMPNGNEASGELELSLIENDC